MWFTGLSGSGRTALATALQERLSEEEIAIYLLDGDVLRWGRCSDLGF